MAIRMITNFVMRMKSRTERRQIIIVGGGSEGAGVDDVVRIVMRMMMKRMMKLGLRMKRMMTRKMMVVGGWRLGGR